MRRARMQCFAVLLTLCVVSVAWAAETYKAANKAMMDAYKKRQYSEAIEAGKKTLEVAAKPDEKATTYFYMGHANLNSRKKRDYKAGEAAFADGLKVEGISAAWRMNLLRGLAYAIHRQGPKRYEDSIAEYRKVIETPKCHRNYRDDATRYIMRMLYSQRKYDEVVAEFEKMMADPKGSWSYKVDAAYYAAAAKYRQKKYAEGQEILKAALALKGVSPYWLGHLRKEIARGDMYQKKYKEAVPLLEEVVAIEKGHAYHKGEALLLLGQCYTALGQKADAEKAYQRVLVLKKAHPRHQKQAKAALDALKKTQ